MVAKAQPNFTELWLAGKPIPEETVNLISGSQLDLSYSSIALDLGETLDTDGTGEVVLPPLPREAKHFDSVRIQENDSSGRILPEHGTDFWGALQGASFSRLHMELSDTSFGGGMDGISSQSISLQHMSGNWDSQNLPRLASSRNLAYMAFESCGSAPNLGDTLPEYLKKQNPVDIWLRITYTPWGTIDEEVFEVLRRNFPKSEIELYKSVFPGFLDSCPKTMKAIRQERVDALPPSKYLNLSKKHRDLLTAREQRSGDHMIVSDVPPFRKMEAIQHHGFPVLWSRTNTPWNLAFKHRLDW